MQGKQISNDLLKSINKRKFIYMQLMNFKNVCNNTTKEVNNIIRNEAPPEEGTVDDSATDETKG